MRLISEDAIQRKADNFGLLLEHSSSPSQAQVSSLATFIHHGYITEMHNMELMNIDLSEVAHASSLADVNVTNNVFIDNVTGNISALISRIKSHDLVIYKMRLSTEDTAALVQGMQTNLVEVILGGKLVELDMDTLLTYDGRGLCGVVQCCGETGERYGDQLATWGETRGWSVEKSSYYVLIVKLREREGQGVDPGRSLKGHL